MGINHWAEEDRPREKLLQRGAQSLTDAELLAIFLRTGTKGKSALDLSQDLLNEFGDLRSLLSADKHRFTQAKGLGDAKYVQLQATVELTKRYLRQCLQRGDVLSDVESTRNYLISELSGYPHEVFACLFLDSKNRVIKFETLFHGTINAANVYPREIAKRALQHNAAALILTHNHPSGIAKPSQEDIAITQHLKTILNVLDIRVLDHFIVGDGYGISLMEQDLL